MAQVRYSPGSPVINDSDRTPATVPFVRSGAGIPVIYKANGVAQS